MAQQSPHATDEAIASAQDVLIDTVTASQQEALETMEAAGQAVFDGLSQVHREITEFVAERIRQDIETQQEFLRCRSLEDVRKGATSLGDTNAAAVSPGSANKSDWGDGG